MTRLGLALLSFASLSLTISCEPQSDSGTNTNWLKQCVASEECNSEDACLCGRCTRDCMTDDDCPSGSVCTEEESASLQCAGEPTATCQPACMTSGECESGRLCHRGVCVDSLPALECSGSVLFCEDFEAPLSADYTAAVTEGNSVERISSGALSGDSSLLASATTAPSTAYLRAPIAAPDSGQLHLSGWVKVPGAVPHDVAPLALWSSTQESWALRLTVRDASVEVWSETTPMTGSYPLALGTWHCLQLTISIADAPQGTADLFIDGDLVETATEVDTLPDGGIEAVVWGDLWAGTASDVEVDRVVVSTTPISCYE